MSLDPEEFLEALVRVGASFAPTNPFSDGVECTPTPAPHVTQSFVALLDFLNAAQRTSSPLGTPLVFKVK